MSPLKAQSSSEIRVTYEMQQSWETLPELIQEVETKVLNVDFL